MLIINLKKVSEVGKDVEREVLFVFATSVSKVSGNCILFLCFSEKLTQSQTPLHLQIDIPRPLLCLEGGRGGGSGPVILGFKEEIRSTPKSSGAASHRTIPGFILNKSLPPSVPTSLN